VSEATRRRGWRLSFSGLLAFAVVAVPVMLSLRFSLSTIDLAYQVRAGGLMLDSGHLLRSDVFTFTAAGHEWLNQQWGAETLFALVFRAGGWELLAIARAAFVGATFWLLYSACRAAGAEARAAGWLTLVALIVALDGLALRPQLLGMTLFALTLWIIAGRERHPRLLWLLPPVVAVWANLHGSFILAPILLLSFWLEDLRRRGPAPHRSLLVAIASIAAAWANPFGLRVWTYVADISADPQIRHTIAEWRPTTPWSVFGAAFFLSALAVVAVLVRARAEVTWPRVLALLVFFALGVTAIRGIIWWALAAPVLVADLLPRKAPEAPDRRTINTVTALALCAISVLFLPWFRPTFAGTANSGRVTDGLLAHAPDRYTALVQHSTRPGSRMFVPELWASWFEFAVPSNPVFADPRIELFPAEIWREYDVVSAGQQGWGSILDRWNVAVLVLSREQQSGLIARIRGNASWETIYEDGDGIMLVRTRAPLGAPSQPRPNP
jgi:hypothetical protein